jgi:ABC-type oligopeptide transport system substrate-binding subunit
MNRLLAIVLCFLIGLVSAACSAAPAAEPTAENVRPTQTSVPSSLNPPRPDAPATGDTFRTDHPSHVAATGRPQLIEFFSFT